MKDKPTLTATQMQDRFRTMFSPFVRMRRVLEAMREIIQCFIVREDTIVDLMMKYHQMTSEQTLKMIDNLKSELKEIEGLIEYTSSNEEIPLGTTRVFNQIFNKQFTSIVFGMKNADKKTVDEVRDLLNSVENVDVEFADKIKGILVDYPEDLNQMKRYCSQFKFFSLIKNVEENVVMIGTNGSGKTTFSRSLKPVFSDNVVILSAQQLLIYSENSNISFEGNALQRLRNFQKEDKVNKSIESVETMKEELNLLVNALMEDYIQKAISCYETGNKESSVLERTIELWHKIIQEKSIVIENTKLCAKDNVGNTYSLNFLSDGEKVVFYYIGNVLLAQQNSYIMIDEPENHLHQDVCNRLWDCLEEERSDCKFIYLTHHVDFALRRQNVKYIWIKQYTPPESWDYEMIEETGLPAELKLSLLGVDRRVCFCEGGIHSLDYAVYSTLFPEYQIVPSGGHEDVINCVKASKASKIDAIGIIDGDNYLPKRIEKWNKNKIYVLKVSEIENILMDKGLLEMVAQEIDANKLEVEKTIAEFWDRFEKNKEKQVTKYLHDVINTQFKDHLLDEKEDFDNLVDQYMERFSSDEIRKIYDNRVDLMERIIKEKDYSEGLKIADLKKDLLDCADKCLLRGYKKKIVPMLRKNHKMREYLMNKYFLDFEIITK